MNTVKKPSTLPTRSRYSRRQLLGGGVAGCAVLNADHPPAVADVPRRPSTSSSFHSSDIPSFPEPPQVQLFGTVGKSPRVVRKITHSKGGTYHSLPRPATATPTQPQRRGDEAGAGGVVSGGGDIDDRLNVHREVRRSVRYKPAPILAHTIVINRTTEIIKDADRRLSGSFDDVSLNAFVVVEGCADAGYEAAEVRAATVDEKTVTKDGAMMEKVDKTEGAVATTTAMTTESDLRFQEQEVVQSKTENHSQEERSRESHIVAAEEQGREAPETVVDSEKAKGGEKEEENWVTETEEIRWKVITETFSDGSVRYFTVKEGGEMTRAELFEGERVATATPSSLPPPTVERAFTQPAPISMERAFAQPAPPSVERAFAKPAPISIERAIAQPALPQVERVFTHPAPPSVERAFAQPAPSSFAHAFAPPAPPPLEHALARPEPPPPPPRMLDLSVAGSDVDDDDVAAAAEEQRRRIAEIEYLQEQLCYHLGSVQPGHDHAPTSFAPTKQSTPIKASDDGGIIIAAAQNSAHFNSHQRMTTSATRMLQQQQRRQQQQQHLESSQRRQFHHRSRGGQTDDRLGMPESDQHLGGVDVSRSGFNAEMGDVLLSDDMSFDAIAAEIRRTMSQTGSVLGNLIEKKEKSAGGV